MTTLIPKYDQSSTGAVNRPFNLKLEETISVKDFGAVGDGTTNDTTAIQNAINAVIAQGGGTLFFPAGTYSINATLTVTGAVILKGAGTGSNSLPTFAAVTKILWNGGSSPMVIMGGNGSGTTVVGGGMCDMQLEGNAYTASRCLVIKDMQRGVFENLYLSYCSDSALYLTNTAGLITGFCDFTNIAIQLIGGTPSTANGININGVSSGVDGTTLCNFYNCTISHDNGLGVLVGEQGDAFNWIKLFTSRPSASTGNGVWFSGTDITKASGYHHFIQPIVSAGFLFSGAGKNVGTKIDNANWGYDNAPNAVLISGAGADEVLCTDMLGFAYGRGLIPENHVSKINDPMQFIYADTTNNAIATSAGLWKYASTGTAPIDGNQAGGAIALTTSTVLNNISAIYAPSNNASGVYLTYNVALDTVVVVNQTANTEYIIGFADSTTADPIQNGVYIKYNYTNSVYFQCVCVKAGTATTVTTTITPSNIDNFYIWSDGTNVSFYYRAVNTYTFTLMASITTNVPTVPLLSLYRAKNKSSSVASLLVYSHKLGFIDEDGF